MTVLSTGSAKGCVQSSLINNLTHFLAKIIDEEFKNSVKLSKSHINNSFELKEKF